MKNSKFNVKCSKGASLVIALVFMLFCVFVGGSVLTAATVNAHRIKDLSYKQETLNQESAVSYLAEDLRLGGGAKIRVIVTEVDRTYQQVEIQKDGTVIDKGGTPQKVSSMTIKVSGSQCFTMPQRVLIEEAIRQYIAYKGGGNPLIEGFYSVNPEKTDERVKISSLSDFKMPSVTSAQVPIAGELNLAISNPVALNQTVRFKFGGDNHYNFSINLDKNDDIGLGGMRVKMNASYEQREPVTVVEIDRINEKRVTTTQTTTMISWANPTIVKVRN